jgi:putative transposase
MLSGVKFRADPDIVLQGGIRQWIGHQRFIRNAKVREEHYFSKFARSALSQTGLRPAADQAYSHFIGPDTAFLKEVPSQILRNGAYRFATAGIRARKGLGGAPRIAKKAGRQSVMLTSELFEFSGEYSDIHTRKVRRDLWLGTKKFPLGRLKFKAHVPYAIPNSICVSVEPSGEWYVSFCYEKLTAEGEPFVLRTPQELAYEYAHRADLESVTEGFDRGVVLPLAASDLRTFSLPVVSLARIAKKTRYVAKYQRRMARQTKGSNRRTKMRLKIARLQRYGQNVRHEFAHRTSHALATSSTEVFVFEDLKLKNMTASPHPKKDDAGRWARNGSAAKAGLNKRLLAGSLGKILQFTTYKAAARNKLVLKVSAQYSSQECSRCAAIDAMSRVSQDRFVCTTCGYAANADTNAACVIKKRGLASLRAGTTHHKKKKTARVRGRNGLVGQVLPEPEETPTPEESKQDGVGDMGPSRAARRSGKPLLQPIAA